MGDTYEYPAPIDPEAIQATVEEPGYFRRSERDKVEALIAAGWDFLSCPDNDRLEPWQWRWRRPSRRPGRPGRLYPSTGQAYNAMIREHEARSLPRGGPD